MRSGLGLLTFFALAAPSDGRAQEPTHAQVLAAFEAQLKKTAEVAGPSVATVVVSKSAHHGKPPADAPWKLGGFDPKAFEGDKPSAERKALAKALDLKEPRAISDHGYAGGVVVDAAGLVLTPYHVIDGATKVYVHLHGEGGKLTGSYADVHAADARSDLAVLKLLTPPPKLQAVTIADVRTADGKAGKATVFPGKLCVLLARPYSAAQGRLGEPANPFGSVTGVRYAPPKPVPKKTPLRHTEYGTFLEYDVKPHAGVTGGALLNLSGELIGLTNAAAAGWGAEFGPGYAVPADEYFRKVVGVLRRGEEVEYGFLGVRPVDETSTVVNPTRDGPAWAAGMRPGDRIERVGGHRVASFDDLLLHVGSALAGSRVEVEVSRDGRTVPLVVTLAKFRHDQPYLASVRPDPVFGLRVDYGSMLAQHPDREVREEKGGVAVREAVPDSPAAARFKPLGDDPRAWLVTHVDGTPVGAPAEFYKAAAGRPKVRLTLYDPSAKRAAEVTLP